MTIVASTLLVWSFGATLMAAPVHASEGEPSASLAESGDAGRVVQAQGSETPELKPRYEPVAPEPKPSYNSAYLFGMTRGVANSALAPGVKVPLFVITVPLDIVFLPFAAVGGFFG